MTELLEVRAVCKAYRGVCVLESVGFRVEPGQCLKLTGSNGAGKSTLLKIIAQIEQPDEGEILYGGRSVRADRAFVRRRIGYIPQDNALAEELTVREQLYLWLAACGVKGKPDAEVVRMLGIDELLKKKIRELSGGMRRRVSIALALATRPELLLADEATEGLDSEYRAALLAHVEKFIKKGGSAVWCTHRTDELNLPGSISLRLDAGRPYLQE